MSTACTPSSPRLACSIQSPGRASPTPTSALGSSRCSTPTGTFSSSSVGPGEHSGWILGFTCRAWLAAASRLGAAEEATAGFADGPASPGVVATAAPETAVRISMLKIRTLRKTPNTALLGNVGKPSWDRKYAGRLTAASATAPRTSSDTTSGAGRRSVPIRTPARSARTQRSAKQPERQRAARSTTTSRPAERVRLGRRRARPQRPIETGFTTVDAKRRSCLRAGPAFGLEESAVAAGFEPAEGCPSRAFEARSLGRSDTPPPKSVPNRWGPERIATGQSRGAGPRRSRRAAAGTRPPGYLPGRRPGG